MMMINIVQLRRSLNCDANEFEDALVFFIMPHWNSFLVLHIRLDMCSLKYNIFGIDGMAPLFLYSEKRS